MAKKKTVRELPFDQRTKRLANQRRTMQKTLRLFAKQYTAHLAEVEDLLLDVAGYVAGLASREVRKQRLRAMNPAQMLKEVLSKKPPTDNDNRAV